MQGSIDEINDALGNAIQSYGNVCKSYTFTFKTGTYGDQRYLNLVFPITNQGWYTIMICSGYMVRFVTINGTAATSTLSTACIVSDQSIISESSGSSAIIVAGGALYPSVTNGVRVKVYMNESIVNIQQGVSFTLFKSSDLSTYYWATS